MYRNIPEELRSRPQWVCWKAAEEVAHYISPDGSPAQWAPNGSWHTFDSVTAAVDEDRADGFALVNREPNPFVVVHIPKTDPAAARILTSLASYAETIEYNAGNDTIKILLATSARKRPDKVVLAADERLVSPAFIIMQGSAAKGAAPAVRQMSINDIRSALRGEAANHGATVAHVIGSWWSNATNRRHDRLVRHLARALLGSGWTPSDVGAHIWQLLHCLSVPAKHGKELFDVATHETAGEPQQEWFAIRDRDPLVRLGTERVRQLRDALGLGIPRLSLGTAGDIAENALIMLERGGRIVSDSALYQYQRRSGIWAAVDPATVDRVIYEFDGSVIDEKPLKLTKTLATQSRQHLETLVADSGFFANAAAGILFQNGFLRIQKSGATLVQHSKDLRARWQLDYAFDAEATCPRFERFLDEIFDGAADADQRKACLQEFVGAALAGIATSYEKGLFLVGEGRNGKGVLAEVIQGLFQPSSVSKVSPQELVDKHRRIHLQGALLNIVTELSRDPIQNTATLKAAISGESIEGSHPHRQRVDFRPKAAHVYSMNVLPPMSETTDGLWSRILILRFDRTFVGATKDNKAELLASLHAERPGITAWAVQGAVRLLGKNAYTEPASHREEVARWRATADPVRAFIDHCTEPYKASMNQKNQAKTLHDTFLRFCGAIQATSCSCPAFTAALRRMGYTNVRGDKADVWPLHVLPQSKWRRFE